MRPLTGIRYSYRAMLKTIVAYLYQLRAIVRREHAFASGSTRKNYGECIRAKSENTPRKRKFIYPTLQFHLAPLSRDKTYICFHVCILISYTRILLRCITSIHLIARGRQLVLSHPLSHSDCYSTPFPSTTYLLHPPA